MRNYIDMRIFYYQLALTVGENNMKETVAQAMPPCFEKWCRRFDDVFSRQAQRREFRNYLGGLLGESERKNISQISKNPV